ncbi:class I SAM-dependent methyltransferase [Haloarcula amylovorans]|uniref:class I SAM-dependent methyltransferase n=1 Tax=Haloarcula amylovorans TaxID=2562280 RepID=UPI001076A2FB|nr:class I SAM-dependent methyltransferase [Halomicroarcula amylolytica]
MTERPREDNTDDVGAANQRLWDAWSDGFQAMWNADTAEGELPPAPFPLPDASSSEWSTDERPELDGADFVELGCGGGQATVGAAREGVETAVGLDFSTAQLRHARSLRNLYGVDAEFVAGDVTDTPFADDAFDIAYSGWVYFMIEDIEAAFREARRVLRDGGLFVFDVPHPFYELFDPETNELERSYHAAGPRRNNIDHDLEEDMIVFDRTVGELHNALVETEFTVERVLEHPDMDDPDEYEDNPVDSFQPDLVSMVPRSLQFWARVT